MGEPSPIRCDWIKASFDKLLALAILLILWPFYMLIVVLIKLEGLFDPAGRGPALYHQVRVSEGRTFPFYKFRITKRNILAEEPRLHRRDRFKTLERSEYCTTVGRYIKKWYLDELPQLFNILRGEMSWVGPRPFPVDDYRDDLRRGHFRKKVIRAGLTGLVQIHKGKNIGKTDVELDEEYVERCRAYSPLRRFFYDLGILFRTVRIIFEGKGL